MAVQFRRRQNISHRYLPNQKKSCKRRIKNVQGTEKNGESRSTITIGQCLTQDYEFKIEWFDLDNIFEHTNEEKIGDNGLGITKDQLTNLANQINFVIQDWVIENNIETSVYMYADIKNVEIVKSL